MKGMIVKRILVLLVLFVTGLVLPAVVQAETHSASRIEFGRFGVLRHVNFSASRLAGLPAARGHAVQPLQTTPAGPTITIQYLSSIYASSTAASAAFTDLHSNLTTGGVTPQDCSSPGIHCELASFSAMDSQGDTLGFDLLYQQIGVCTAEIVAAGALADIQQNAQAAATIVSNVTNAASTALTASCGAASATPGTAVTTPATTPTPASLIVAASAFSPATIQSSGEANNDAAAQTVPGAFHTQSYAALNRIDGSLQSATLAVTVPTPSGPPTVSLTGLALVHTVKGKVQTTKSIKVKEAATFLATYAATNGGSLSPTATIKITEGKKSLGTESMSGDTASDGTTYFYANVKFKAKTPLGTLKAHITITLGTATAKKTLTFKLLK